MARSTAGHTSEIDQQKTKKIFFHVNRTFALSAELECECLVCCEFIVSCVWLLYNETRCDTNAAAASAVLFG